MFYRKKWYKEKKYLETGLNKAVNKIKICHTSFSDKLSLCSSDGKDHGSIMRVVISSSPNRSENFLILHLWLLLSDYRGSGSEPTINRRSVKNDKTARDGPNIEAIAMIHRLYSVRGLEPSELGVSHGCPGRLWDPFLWQVYTPSKASCLLSFW